MERSLRLDQTSPAKAAHLLARLARQLEAGVLDVGGSRVRVVEPVDVSVELDTSPITARMAITLRCRRPDGGSRLLREELARPGG
jgi:hypothetical protein